MKNLSKLCVVFAFIFLGVNAARAQTSLKDDRAMKAKEVKSQINSKDFVFEATQAGMKKGEEPLKYHKYDVAVVKDTLIANLPGVSKGPLKVATTDYTFNETRGKNGYNIVIMPKAGVTSDVKEIKMKVTPQGHASLRVETGHHGPLELFGYIKQEDY